jgi:hypothetical protein
MGALSSLNLADNNLGALVPPEGWIVDDSIFYGPNDEEQGDPPPGSTPAGITAVANAIRDMGAILSVNLLQNDIGTNQAETLASMLKEHLTLKSLCGNKGDETNLDMSGKMEGAEDAIMLAAEIVDNGMMTSLNLASNSLGIEGAKIIAAILPKCA